MFISQKTTHQTETTQRKDEKMADVAKRPKRQVARNKIYTDDNVLTCNPAHFVGYVEDLETPEMISTFSFGWVD